MRAVLIAALACAAPGCGFETLDARACPPGGTDATWETFGAGFMDRHCQGCHGSSVTEREGAPGEFIFDTREQVRRHAARIYARSAAGNDSMPPGPDDPTPAERERLATWLACGAP